MPPHQTYKPLTKINSERKHSLKSFITCLDGDVKITKESMDLDKDTTMGTCVMFVDGMPFMASISIKIKFTTIEYVPQ
jgi:hypothetical protein